jgi:hypothetical protein
MSRGFAALLVGAALGFGCSEHIDVTSDAQRTANECSGALAVVGTTQITADEVSLLRARTNIAGRRLETKQALRDLVWQESKRQELKLPGGDKLEASRRAVIAHFSRELLEDPSAKIRWEALPSNTTLTACGKRLLSEPPGRTP